MLPGGRRFRDENRELNTVVMYGATTDEHLFRSQVSSGSDSQCFFDDAPISLMTSSVLIADLVQTIYR